MNAKAASTVMNVTVIMTAVIAKPVWNRYCMSLGVSPGNIM